MTDPADLTAHEAARSIRNGELTSCELVDACIGRIEAREADIRAWTYFDAEQARVQARRLDDARAAGEPLGPLHGVPVGVKDIIATADMPTEDGTPANRGRQPTEDAFCVRVLREAGAVIMGKTVTTELATRHPGKTRNPHNLDHTPGGSSSGSAAAVACGMVPLALGTQTGGSVIRPASFCGIHGLKPTLGMISRTGVTVQSHTLDTVGVYGRSIEDLALIAEVLSVADEADEVSYSRPPATLGAAASDPVQSPPRLAFLRTPAWEAASESARAAILTFVEQLGGRCAEVPAPPSFADIIERHRCVQYAENVHHFREIEARARDLLSPSLQKTLDEARKIPAGDYLDAVRSRDSTYAELTDLLASYDAVVCLPSAGSAPKGLDWTGDPIFNGLWTYLGVPAVTLPLLEADGLPLGLQLVGKRREEGRLLRVAAWVERAAADR